MGEEDYAIIIGLKDYPGLTDAASGRYPLEGPEYDAVAFKDWVVSPSGGNIDDDSAAVDPIHVQMILSSQYNKPAFKSYVDARPVLTDVQAAFIKLKLLSESNIGNLKGPRVGRRLYIFMAGHGIAPSTYGDKNEKEAALLMANVEPSSFAVPTYHIPGSSTASWFGRNDCFDEIFLFMDCCREDSLVSSLNIILPPRGTSATAKRCFAFGTRWSRLSRERPMPDEGGRTRGVFTKTLLLGLSGAAAELNPDDLTQGVITVASLKSFLIQNTKEFLGPSVNDAEFQEPDVDYWPRGQDGRDIPIMTVPLPKFPVTIHPPAGAGYARVVYHPKDRQVLMMDTPAIPLAWDIDLPRGAYIVEIIAGGIIKDQIFYVKGIEGLAGKARLNVTV